VTNRSAWPKSLLDKQKGIRGTSMTSKPVSALLADLGVTRSHSRPQVSNDCEYESVAFGRV